MGYTASMKNTVRLLRANPRISLLYLVFIVIYLVQALLPAPDKAALHKYHISASSLHLLGLSVEIPYVIIWVIALVGYLRLKTYANLIQKDKDGEAFKGIARGLLWLSLWLPLNSILQNFFQEIYRRHPEATANLVRLDNYISIGILFIGFLFVYEGSYKLLPLVTRNRFQASLTVVFVSIVFATLYMLLTMHDPARAHPTSEVPVATYYESDWLITTTNTIPRLFSWFLGVQAVYNIVLYSQRVKGKLYRVALKNLAMGLSVVIAALIVLRSIQSLASALEDMKLSFLVGLVFLIVILIGVGYALVATGATRLQRLEEV